MATSMATDMIEELKKMDPVSLAKILEQFFDKLGKTEEKKMLVIDLDPLLKVETDAYISGSSRRDPNLFVVGGEDISRDCRVKGMYVPSVHPLIAYIHACFSYHLLLILLPEHFMTLISQGFSAFVNGDPEKYRKHMGVKHEGKKKLDVNTAITSLLSGEDITKSLLDNVFLKFKTLLGENMSQDLINALTTEFTTSTPDINIASIIGLMEVAKSYFEYCGSTRCGIPKIQFGGTREDWAKLVAVTHTLETQVPEPEIKMWTKCVREILGRIVDCFDGKVDVDFFKSIYKYESCSGGSTLSGWICAFFPKNCTFLPESKIKSGLYTHELDSEDVLSLLPAGVSTVEFTDINMEVQRTFLLNGGFLPYSGQIKAKDIGPPVITWWITEKVEEREFRFSI